MGKEKYDQEEFNGLLKQKTEEYMMLHVPKIEIRGERTVISFAVKDYITEKSMQKIWDLFNLCGIPWYFGTIPFGANLDDTRFEVIVDVNDERLTEFVQKFIENDYVLKWW